MSIDRHLTPGVTLTDKAGVVKVDECIKYIESCGWTLRRRTTGYYAFHNPNANEVHRDMTFTLAELRHAYINGW
jgi:hypothetical protein